MHRLLVLSWPGGTSDKIPRIITGKRTRACFPHVRVRNMNFARGVVEPEEATRKDRDNIFSVIDPRELCHMRVDVIRKVLVTDLYVSDMSDSAVVSTAWPHVPEAVRTRQS